MQREMCQEEFVIPYANLTVEKFNKNMQENGCLMIQGLFPAEEIEIIKCETLDLFYVIKNLIHNNLINENNSKYLAGGHPAGILPSLEMLEFVLNKSVFIDCLKSYFKKETFEICVESTGIRRCDPEKWKNFLPWHQDIFNREDSFFTCWMPLMTIDEKTAGLDLVPKKVKEQLGSQDGLEVSYNGNGLSEELINEKVTSLRWRPKMEVGDILIFDPYCPHRTSYDPSFSIERYSIDIRIQPKGCKPDGTWVTNVINLPSNKQFVKKNYNSRSMFQLQHLITVDLPNLGNPETERHTTSKKGFVKKIFKKIANFK